MGEIHTVTCAVNFKI